jgi:LuxR family transcriptional regulator, quorum-sensing system regulator BjaR1
MLEKTAFDAIDNFRRFNKVEDVKRIFEQAVSTFGCKAFIICDIPPSCLPCERDIQASGWQPEWQKKYLEFGYAKDDPVPNSVYRKTDPYYWSEALNLSGGSIAASNILNEARNEFNMEGGYCVPIHGLSGLAGVVSIATDQKNWKLSEQQDAALHMISLYAYEAVRKTKEHVVPDGGGLKLSPREVECVRWVAEGKTNWEIGTILGISQYTAGEYIDFAGRKLGTRGRAHLVARAIRHNIIH